MQQLALVQGRVHVLLHVAVALALQVRILLVIEQLGQNELFDSRIASFLLQWDVKQLVLVRFVVLTNAQAVEILIIQVAERLNDQLLAQLLVFAMLEVGVEDEADAPLLDDMVTQADLDPLHVLLETVDGLVQQLRLDQTLDIYLGNMRRC